MDHLKQNKPQTAERMRITVDDKLKIIDLLETKEMNRVEVAERYNTSKSTISKIMKNKSKYNNAECPADTIAGKVRMRKLKYYELELPLYSFIENGIKLGKSVTGNAVKAEATRLGKLHGLVDFKASNGWLYKFQRRFKAINNKDFHGNPVDVEKKCSKKSIELLSDDEDLMDENDSCDPLLEPTVELNEAKPSDSEVNCALNTVKLALEANTDVPFEIWQAYFEVKQFLAH